MDADYSTSSAKLSSQHVGTASSSSEAALAPERRAPTNPRIEELTDKVNKLKRELQWATLEAAEEGMEKPVYVAISNISTGCFGCDWYMFDLVKKQRIHVFERLEWEGSVYILSPGVAVCGTVIYILGGSYLHPEIGSEADDVLYFDTKYPQDGWKVGPRLPYAHLTPFATSIGEKLYVFGSGSPPNVLDTSDREAGWKVLPEYPRGSVPFAALPDPSRDRILFVTHQHSLLAYSVLENKWESIDPNFDRDLLIQKKKHIYGDLESVACVVVGDVLYYTPHGPFDDILRAYDLVNCQSLTVVYHNFSYYRRHRWFLCWDRLLDLGHGKLCLVNHSVIREMTKLYFLKLKVEKETGENKVHVTIVSAQHFTMEDFDGRFEGALTFCRPNGKMGSGLIGTSSMSPMISPTRKRKREQQEMDPACDVGTDSEEEEEAALAPERRAPTNPRIKELTDKLNRLERELHWATLEAAKEGMEKPVYVAISNTCKQGRFGCDWYKFDLVKKQRIQVFERMEWEGGIAILSPAVAACSNVIYVLGGAYRYPKRSMQADEVLYFDTDYPQNGWKVGPRLPYAHLQPLATSIGENLYVFGVRTPPNVLDTAVMEAGWKDLPQYPRGSVPLVALPDPSRNRNLFVSFQHSLVAYSLLENKWEYIDRNFDTDLNGGPCAVVGDVLYYSPHGRFDGRRFDDILRAYDLVNCQRLTAVYHNFSDYRRHRWFLYWDYLLDLGHGKLCLVNYFDLREIKKLYFLKLKVEKETGEDKVHVTVLSAQHFTVEDSDSRLEGALTF